MREGFSLLELLTSIAVLALLGAVILQITVAVARTTNLSNRLLDRASQARLAYERIGMDLAGSLKRNDVDFLAANVPVGGTNKVLQFITGVSSSGKSQGLTSDNNRGLSVVAYRLVPHADNNNLPCLVRAGKTIPWHVAGPVSNAKFMGLQSDGLPVRFTDVAASPKVGFPQELLPSNDADYDVLGAGVIRVVIGFQLYPDNQPVKLQDGTLPGLSQGQIVYSPPVRTVLSSDGVAASYVDFTRISALVVGLITFDLKSQALVTAAQIEKLAGAFPVPASGSILAAWAPIAGDVARLPADVPLPARQALRASERYFPITPFPTRNLLEK